MTWQDALALTSGLVSIVVLLGSTLGRETIGELKRRVTGLEEENRKQAAKIAEQDKLIATLSERTNGMTASLSRIEEQMVPRAEWEARHAATDGMLKRILDRLEGRDSAAQLEPPPPMPGRRLSRQGGLAARLPRAARRSLRGMRDVLVALAYSRKAWVLLLAVIGVVVMTLVGKVTGDQALGFLKWLIPAWFAAVAVEDAAQKHGEAVAAAASAFAPPRAAEPEEALPPTPRDGGCSGR